MLLEIYILLQISAIAALVSTFYAKSVMPSLLTVFTSAVLMVGAWVIETGQTYVWDASIRAYVAEAVVVSTNYLAYINMAIFGLGLLFFFHDIMTVAKGGSLGSFSEDFKKKEGDN